MGIFIGQIILFAGDHVPAGFLPCDGKSYTVQGQTKLYAVIKNLYGGDDSNFNVPNLIGRVPLGALATHPLAASGGQLAASLQLKNLPFHTHQAGFSDETVPDATVQVQQTWGNTVNPIGNQLAMFPAASGFVNFYGQAATPGAYLGGTSASIQLGDGFPPAGTDNPALFSLMQPYLALNYYICCNGDMPT